MSYTEARSHFENAKNTTDDKTLMEMAKGLKHLSDAIVKDIRTIEQLIRILQNLNAGPT